MRINVKRDTDFAVSHKILQRFRVHACLCLIAAVGMVANMRSYIRHLHPVNLVVLADHPVEAMFPMQRYQRHTFIVEVQETAVSVNKLLLLRLAPVLDDCLKAPGNLLSDRNLPLTGICLGGLDHILHVGSTLKLVVNIDDTVLQVNVLQRQPAEFR